MKGSYTHAKAWNHRPILRGRIKISWLEGGATLMTDCNLQVDPIKTTGLRPVSEWIKHHKYFCKSCTLTTSCLQGFWQLEPPLPEVSAVWHYILIKIVFLYQVINWSIIEINKSIIDQLMIWYRKMIWRRKIVLIKIECDIGAATFLDLTVFTSSVKCPSPPLHVVHGHRTQQTDTLGFANE